MKWLGEAPLCFQVFILCATMSIFTTIIIALCSKKSTTTTVTPNKTSRTKSKEKDQLKTDETQTADQNLQTAEPVAEIQPKNIPKTEKQKQIAKGDLKRGKFEYPTMDDVISDWETQDAAEKKGRTRDTKTPLDDPPG